MNRELKNLLHEVVNAVNDFRVVGQGISGSFKQGYKFNVEPTVLGLGDGGPPPEPGTGACCVDGVCSITTASYCGAIGGTYQGDNTVCDPNPCPTTDVGGCCIDGACSEETRVQCAIDGGSFYGEGSDCGSIVCDECCTCAPGFCIDEGLEGYLMRVVQYVGDSCWFCQCEEPFPYTCGNIDPTDPECFGCRPCLEGGPGDCAWVECGWTC